MKEMFEPSFELTVGHEGGYQNDPKDRGNWTTGVIGKGINKGTKYGVSAMAYPKLDIKNLSLESAQFIYHGDYWNKASCDDWPRGVDYMVFDAAVNHGVSRAIKFLQSAVGVNADGVVGPKTKAAVRATDIRKLIADYGITRDAFFDSLNNDRFIGGWRRRAFETTLNAYDMYLKRLT